MFISLSLNRLIQHRLRLYAITSKNKILAAYFGTLALARLAMTLASTFSVSPTIINLPQVPIDAFDLCAVVVEFKFKLVPNSIGCAFGALVVALVPVDRAKFRGLLITGEHLEISIFLVIVWYTYHNQGKFRFSALVRTIITEATIYFLVMSAMQTYVLISWSLMSVWSLSLCSRPIRDH